LWRVLWQFPELDEGHPGASSGEGDGNPGHLDRLGTVQICGTVQPRHQIDFYLNKVETEKKCHEKNK